MQNQKLKEQIEDMAAPAKPTHEKLASLISGWDEYFANMGIVDEVEQEQEFHSIVRARLQSGVVSLIAPMTLSWPTEFFPGDVVDGL